ncbi:hypothetical protein E2C01_055145 [Portunus trituberculatus]|uniref:Uncharacterized protein n=1 Tax=Portunus trituberculatus TaxID=210409 RepID=A0A5B7GQE9_PORTR|nr:hypothetical protein [Portunus trituberculatus]
MSFMAKLSFNHSGVMLVIVFSPEGDIYLVISCFS